MREDNDRLVPADSKYTDFIQRHMPEFDRSKLPLAIEVMQKLDIQKQYEDVVMLFKQAVNSLHSRKKSPNEVMAMDIENHDGAQLIVLILPGGKRFPIPTLETIAKGILANIDMYSEKVREGFTVLSIAPLALALGDMYKMMARHFRELGNEVSVTDYAQLERNPAFIPLVHGANAVSSLPEWRVSLRKSPVGAPNPLPGEDCSTHIKNGDARQCLAVGEQSMTLHEALCMFLGKLAQEQWEKDVVHGLVALGSQNSADSVAKNPCVYFDPEDPEGPVVNIAAEDDSVAHPVGTAQTVVPIQL